MLYKLLVGETSICTKGLTQNVNIFKTLCLINVLVGEITHMFMCLSFRLIEKRLAPPLCKTHILLNFFT